MSRRAITGVSMQTNRSEYEVSRADHRLRLDRFVCRACPQLSRRSVERLLRTGAILVNGRPRDRHYFVKTGERISIRMSESPAGAASAAPRILYHGNGLIAVAKPPGLPTVPAPLSAGPPPSSLLAWLEDQPHLHHRPGVVHRLDRETSGLVLFSLTPDAHRRILRAFRRHAIGKIYWALCQGRISPRSGRIVLALKRDRSGRMHADPAGQPARTDYRTLEVGPRWSLLRVSPHTGRTHQIRVHLAAAGHPIAGDPVYGTPAPDLTPPRMWLHARTLVLPDRIAAQVALPRRLACPLWDDLETDLRGLRRAGRRPPG